MAPRFRDGDFAGGITAGALACAGRIAAEKGVKLEWDGRELRYDRDGGDGGMPVPVTVLLVLFFFVLPMLLRIITGGRRRRGWGGWYIGPGGFGGGFGGGGFGGGGFGGGGSFGGFGGGSSGGGGGGGKW
jgi:uncharacterized protein